MMSPNELKALRISKGFTQKDLAAIVGTTQTTITNIEKGVTKNPNIDIALRMAKALDADVFELFGDESLNYQSSKTSDKELDRMKVLVFHSLDKYESNQIFLKQFDYNQEDPEDWKKFEEYRLYLSEFKKGIFEKLIEVGFCTQEDIKEYRTYLNKQANERKFVTKIVQQHDDEDPNVRELLDEIVVKIKLEEMQDEIIKFNQSRLSQNKDQVNTEKVKKST